ncbi:DUF305 domain-containing protein [Lysobacter humi (ex Lee et al. 2017)]
MNARKPLNVAVSMVLGTALAVVATGCAKSDNAEAPAADTSTAAASTDAAASAAANASAGADTGAQSPGSMELHRVMEEGEAMPMTMSGDVDKDFASMMTMHHQTAIKMIDVLQQNGQSAELKALGAKMKADQLEEIKKMAPHASAAGAAATGHEGMAGMDHSQGTDAQGGTAAAELHRIMEESKAMPMTMSGNVDKDFATMMTMHHKAAIKMIDVLQQNGKHADLKALGAKMKANQQAEIAKMEPFTK